ncbi:FAR-17a/AIG1-like protein-domain-containing protein [Bipolaris maydis]|nr:FAR-17a/AIG1-like protein-domain-containing protein [Bipolaris maydis]
MASKTSAEIKPTSSRRHPLQRFDSPSKGFSGALHVLGLISFYLSFKFLIDNPNVFSSSFGWHLQFLTILGLSISTLTFIVALLADLTSTSLDQSPDMPSDPPAAALSSHLFRLKNYLALVAAPMEITISVLYWTIKAIDGKLLVSPEIPLPPVFYDIGFHLVPAVVLTTDSLLLSPPWPTTPMNESAPMITLSLSTIVAFSYWIWIEICYSQNGFYPYPIFQILTTSQRVGLFVVSGVIMWVVGGGLRIAYAKVNGYESVEHLDKVRRSKVMGGSGKWE